MVADLKGHSQRRLLSIPLFLSTRGDLCPAGGLGVARSATNLSRGSPGCRCAAQYFGRRLGDVDAPLGDVLVCGDNAEAKQKVMEIIQRIGARAFDGGPAGNAYVIEGLTGVIISLNRKYKSKHGSIKITGIGD